MAQPRPARPATAPAALPIHRSTYGAMEVVDAPYQSMRDDDGQQQQQPQGGVRTQARPRPRRRQPQAKGKGGCLGISGEDWFKGVVYGLINASICLPASISFSTIIFRHEAFAPHLPVLVRLVIFSSAVHAAIFVWLSSMPFAVGQVQVSLPDPLASGFGCILPCYQVHLCFLPPSIHGASLDVVFSDAVLALFSHPSSPHSLLSHPRTPASSSFPPWPAPWQTTAVNTSSPTPSSCQRPSSSSPSPRP